MVYFTFLVFVKNIHYFVDEAVLTCTYNLCFGLKEEKYLPSSSVKIASIIYNCTSWYAKVSK